jgi:imidazolonepropionase-like amidohydrolase/ABC-type multidrug transport system permease subunit
MAPGISRGFSREIEMNAYLAQIRMNLRLTLRDRTVVVFNYLFPLLFFFLFGQIMHADQGGTVVLIVNMVLTIGVIGAGLFGTGMRTVMEREANILRRFKVAPISPGPILVAGLVSGLVNFIPVIFVVLMLARLIYRLPPIEHPFSLYAFVLIGMLAFRAIGSIIGAVANSMQEAQIVVQLLYFPFLFLGGATFPIASMPNWLQIVAQFIPSTYLSTGVTAILQGHETIFDNLPAAGALLVTAVVGTFLAMKLFRWEKEEKMRGSAKLWLAVVLLPFIGMGVWQAYAKDNVAKGRILAREVRRSRTVLIRDARVFVGDGTVIDRGSVLIKNGKIDQVFPGDAPDAASLKAEGIEAAGKTLMPGLIDVHVHLGSPGGFYADQKEYIDVDGAIDRELAAYLYSGVTAVKSVGDATDVVLKHRGLVNSGEKAGAELFAVGPMFTAPGGHGTEYIQYVPEAMRSAFAQQLVRLPKSPEEARKQVDELKKQGVDGIKAILEGGPAGHSIPRLDPALLRAIAVQARADGLPIVVHTGNARDVTDALDAGVNGIEHGSLREVLPEALFTRMKQSGVFYDPTLAVAEALIDTGLGKTDPLERSLVQQVGPAKLLQETKKFIASAGGRGAAVKMDVAEQNLGAAFRAGVTLVTGTDSGNPQMIHGPGIHRELQLWVAAGIPPAEALQAATYNGARLLRVDRRMGLIRKGYDASLLLVDGNPLQDISSTEHISMVFLKGEHVDRSELLQKK